jgi:tRNA threonylcarbamoyladenosine biosynthesis protein TsaE
MPAHLSVELPDEAATLRLGAVLAAGVAPGRVLTLRGPLGSGKTTLVRGLLRALGYQGRVKSPSYTLVELYTFSRLNLYHFDFYRFKDRSEWLNSGFRDYFNAASACIVEWPERVAGLLGPSDLDAQIAFALPGRTATLRGETSDGRNWVDAVRRQWSQAHSP